tara:strand:- start:22 stop:204 length:183 start_codon:yes stop_codon:yes gene_type:complete
MLSRFSLMIFDKYKVGIKIKNVACIKVFLNSFALPIPLKIPSKVNAMELNGCARMMIQKV